MIEIKKNFGNNDLEDPYYIRRAVFVYEQGFSEEVEFDDNDSDATHYVIYFNSQPVGTARLRIIDNKAKIERVAVLKDQRRKEYGQILISQVIDDVKKNYETSTIWLISQLKAISFYEKLGFNSVGDHIIQDGILCQKMEMIL